MYNFSSLFNRFFKLLTITLMVQNAFASEELLVVKVLNKALAIQATYTTQELDDPSYYPLNWFYNGRVLSPIEAKKLILEGQSVCNLWATMYSDDRNNLTAEYVKNRTLDLGEISLWKNVSGRLIFLDEESEFVLTYNCIKGDEKGNPIEITDLSIQILNDIFKGVINIISN